jgi:hypothetical protein
MFTAESGHAAGMRLSWHFFPLAVKISLTEGGLDGGKFPKISEKKG